MELYTEATIYILITINSYTSYLFGLVAYITMKQLVNTFYNHEVTDATKQFYDFLTLRQREARWFGY